MEGFAYFGSCFAYFAACSRVAFRLAYRGDRVAAGYVLVVLEVVVGLIVGLVRPSFVAFHCQDLVEDVEEFVLVAGDECCAVQFVGDNWTASFVRRRIPEKVLAACELGVELVKYDGHESHVDLVVRAQTVVAVVVGDSFEIHGPLHDGVASQHYGLEILVVIA